MVDVGSKRSSLFDLEDSFLLEKPMIQSINNLTGSQDDNEIIGFFGNNLMNDEVNEIIQTDNQNPLLSPYDMKCQNMTDSLNSFEDINFLPRSNTLVGEKLPLANDTNCSSLDNKIIDKNSLFDSQNAKTDVLNVSQFTNVAKSRKSNPQNPTSSHLIQKSTNSNKSVREFVYKVWVMVENPKYSSFIIWSESGDSIFLSTDQVDSSAVLPLFFKHKNLSSFIRQLNLYGFIKNPDIVNLNCDNWINFINPYFQRGRPDLLTKINRKIPQNMVTANKISNSSYISEDNASNTTIYNNMISSRKPNLKIRYSNNLPEILSNNTNEISRSSINGKFSKNTSNTQCCPSEHLKITDNPRNLMEHYQKTTSNPPICHCQKSLDNIMSTTNTLSDNVNYLIEQNRTLIDRLDYTEKTLQTHTAIFNNVIMSISKFFGETFNNSSLSRDINALKSPENTSSHSLHNIGTNSRSTSNQQQNQNESEGQFDLQCFTSDDVSLQIHQNSPLISNQNFDHMANLHNEIIPSMPNLTLQSNHNLENNLEILSQNSPNIFKDHLNYHNNTIDDESNDNVKSKITVDKTCPPFTFPLYPSLNLNDAVSFVEEQQKEQ